LIVVEGAAMRGRGRETEHCLPRRFLFPHPVPFPFEKMRPAELVPGAQLQVWHARDNARPEHQRVMAMEKPLGPTPRGVRSEGLRSFRRSNHRGLRDGRLLSTREVTDAVSARLVTLPTKAIQAATGGSVRAAENVKAGLNAMSLTNFLNACRAIPELRALAMELMGCEAETDPEFVKGLSLLMNSFARRNARDEDETFDPNGTNREDDG
jgi:hypothetical protein